MSKTNMPKFPYCGGETMFLVYCLDCGAEGPIANDEAGAVREFNKLSRPLPVKRDEQGPVREKTVKELFAKIDEELTEFKAAVLAVLNLDDTPSDLPTGIYPVIADEAVDSITAIVTNCEALGIDADDRAAAIARCNRRNQDRGRL